MQRSISISTSIPLISNRPASPPRFAPDVRMTGLKSSLPFDPDVLAGLRQELARAAAVSGLTAGPTLWLRFAGYYQGLSRLPRRLRRTLQRQWRRSLGSIALLCALGQAPALAATINVDGVSCTLIDAITAANNNGLAGGCSAGSGADTIVLPPNSIHTLTAVNNTPPADGPNGLPVIISPITIDGNGSTIRREPSAPEFRILAVDSGGNLTLQETTVSGGMAGRDVLFGGGIFNRGGTLVVSNSTLSGNFAYQGGGIWTGGSATLTNCTLSGNTALGSGAGINNSRNGNLTLTSSTISGNTAGQGAGISSIGNNATLSNVTIRDNTANFGGGIESGGGTNLTLTDSTISGNTAINTGGGIFNQDYGSATLTNSTISSNRAFRGGGISNFGTIKLNTVTITMNTATSPYGGSGFENVSRGIVNISNTIIAQNTSDEDCVGFFNSQGFNLIGNNQDCGGFGANGDRVGTPGNPINAMLSALANNGGPTHTHALVFGSPAIDAVASGCPPPATDQRGVTRPRDGDGDTVANCDIGAFEVAGTPPPTQADLSLTKADSPDPVTTGQQLTYTLRVTNNGSASATGVTVTDPLPGGVTFVSATPSRGTCSGTATVTCPLGSLANGESATVAIVVTPTSAGALSNTATVTGNPNDPNPGNNSATSATTVEPPLPSPADLSITKADSSDPVTAGQQLTYTLTVRNNGPAGATSVQVTDVLPGGVTFVSATPSQGSCGGTATVTCPVGSLANGESATVAIVVTPISEGALSNTARAAGNQTDPIPENNSATSATTVQLLPTPPPPPQPPVIRPDGPRPVATCRARGGCEVLLTCQATTTVCTGRVDLTVRASALRLGRDPSASASARRRITFARAMVNVPPGQTTVRLQLTRNGRKIVRQANVKRLRGRLEVRNTSGAIVSNTPITIRLRAFRPR